MEGTKDKAVGVSERSELSKALALRYQIAERESALSLQGFLDSIVINASPEPRMFRDVRQTWQTQLFADLDTKITRLAGIGKPLEENDIRKFWYTLPRGHDKTSAIARRCNWLLGYSRRRLNMATAAGDYEQAALIPEMMESELNLNPWLQERVSVKRTRAYGTGGVLKILNSDFGSSWGLNCDLVILDEITWWEKEDLFRVLLSGNAKRRGIFVIITNAGLLGSWQRDKLDEIKDQKDQWHVWEAPEGVRLATWMSEKEIENDRRLLPGGLAKRVYDNIWIDPGEESGYLVRSDVEACEAQGLSLGLQHTDQGVYGIDYVAAVDYGPKRDRTCCVVVHHDPEGRIRVDDFQIWQGRVDEPIEILRIEGWIEDINKRFFRPVLVFDPYQMEGTAQKYEYNQTVVRFEAHGGKTNYEMAAHLRSLVVNRRLVWYPGAGDLLVKHAREGTTRLETFKDELVQLVIVDTPYGYRFDHKKRINQLTGVGFHDDRAVAIGMAALIASRRAPSPDWLKPPELKKKEVVPLTAENMDLQKRVTNFRDMYGMENREMVKREGRTGWELFGR